MVQACQARAGEQGVSAPQPGPPISMGHDGSVLGSRSRSRVRGLLEGATLSLVLRGVLCALSPLPSPERSSRWRSCPRSEDLSSGLLGMGGSRVLACPLMCSCCARLARVCRCVIGLVCSRPPSFLGSPSDFSSLRRVVPSAGWGSGALPARLRAGSRSVRRVRVGLGAYEVVSPVPALVHDRERRLVFELNHHLIGCGVEFILVLIVSGLFRRAREASAQDALVDEQIQVGVDVFFQV